MRVSEAECMGEVSEDALFLGERLVRLSVSVFINFCRKRVFKTFPSKTRVCKTQVLFKF